MPKFILLLTANINAQTLQKITVSGFSAPKTRCEVEGSWFLSGSFEIMPGGVEASCAHTRVPMHASCVLVSLAPSDVTDTGKSTMDMLAQLDSDIDTVCHCDQ
eukprot:2724232-Amphidinium_carterae.2